MTCFENKNTLCIPSNLNHQPSMNFSQRIMSCEHAKDERNVDSKCENIVLKKHIEEQNSTIAKLERKFLHVQKYEM